MIVNRGIKAGIITTLISITTLLAMMAWAATH